MAGFSAAPMLILSMLLALTRVQAQSCYYPDGSLSTTDAPCPASSICCPLNWQCLSNGMCFDPNNDYYDRKTCTDKDWGSDCPDFCTYSAGGGEAMMQCADGKWCCNGNRVDIDCCEDGPPDGTDYMDIPDGKVIGTISEMPSPAMTPSSEQSTSSSEDEDSTSTTAIDTTSSSTSASSSNTLTTTITTTTSRASSTSSAIPSASQNLPMPVPTSDSDHNSSNNDHHTPTGTIAGLAIGMLAMTALMVAGAYLGWRYLQKQKVRNMALSQVSPSTPDEFKFGQRLAPGAHAPEIDSAPVARTNRTSELQGSDGYGRYSTVSSMSPNAQGYSPSSMASPVVSTGGGSGGAGGRMGHIDEKSEPPPAELWGGHVYRPYRPGLEGQGANANTQEGQEGGQSDGNTHPYKGT